MHGTFRAVETTGRKHGKPIELRPLHPNQGTAVLYRSKLDKLLDEMNASLRYWLESAYRNNEPIALAMDDSALPANALARVLKKLADRWLGRFDDASKELAVWFAKDAQLRSDSALRAILKRGGWSVRFRTTPAIRDAMKAAVKENVALIRSLPQEYLTQVNGIVMRSAMEGRDLGYLAKKLEKQFGVTRRRAALISRDQNNKLTAVVNRTRQQELGITKARWRHSGGGKHPRPSHVAMNRKTYDVAKGMWDPAIKEWIFPGTLINCRCASISIVEGFS